MKYFCLFMALLSAIFTGVAIANNNYGIALLNFFCVYLNINSYKRFCNKEIKDLDIK